MNALDLTRINRLAPYKVWTEDGCDYLIETSRGQIFVIGFGQGEMIRETRQ